ncbi:MAG: hypothetical protein KBD55_00860 [Candidatus Pacebacteria bacterium]|nr:hypothetical protein [Candidatus Paceibacterota bacterium]
MYKSLYFIYIIAKNSTEQKKRVIFQMFNHLIFMFLSFYLYTHIYKLSPGLQAKLPFVNTIWSMAAYFIVFWLGVRNVERRIREDILSGNIEMYLLRPMGYIWQKVFVVIGQGLAAFISAFVLSFVVSYFLVGMPIIDTPPLLWILGFLLLLFLSQFLTCLLFILCGLAGFWFDNSEPFHFIISKLIMIFGGAWVPIAFFPKAMQLIAEFSPFGGAMAVSFALYPNFSERFPLLVLNAVFWIFVCLLLVRVISKRAFNNLAVNG